MSDLGKLTYIETESMVQHWRARQTLTEMMNDRHYDVVKENWNVEGDIDERALFMKLWYEKNNFFDLTMRAVSQADVPKSPTILIFFPDEEKLKINMLREMITYTERVKCVHIIIVYIQSITSFAKNQLGTIVSEKNIRIEQFSIEELQFNPTKHDLVPKHIILSKQEKDEVMRRERCIPDDFPIIKTCDPIARYIGAKPNQLIAIEKIIPGGKRSTHYRICKLGIFKK